MTVPNFSGLAIGQVAGLSHTVTERDVLQFAELTGDFNPAHVDEAWAKQSRFGGRIAHGMLSAGFISACIATRLPGPGAIYLGQTLRFTRPVRIGDTVTVTVEVVEVMTERRRVRLATTCRNQHDQVVLDGEAMVLVPDEESTPAS